jgi:hypothetical protein
MAKSSSGKNGIWTCRKRRLWFDALVSRPPTSGDQKIEEDAMPRFMGLVKMEENLGNPPQALFDAMDKYIGEQAAAGHFLDGGGLFGTEDAVNFISRDGAVSRVDGPYAEAKEVVGGWALLQYDTLEEAIAGQEEFADLHAKYWPEVTVVATLRQISEAPPEASDA